MGTINKENYDKFIKPLFYLSFSIPKENLVKEIKLIESQLSHLDETIKYYGVDAISSDSVTEKTYRNQKTYLELAKSLLQSRVDFVPSTKCS